MSKAEEGGVLIRQRDRSVRVFDELECHTQMYLAQMDLLREKSVHSEVLEAVRQATPESRAAFEQRFGSIAMTCHVIASGEKGAWAKEYKLLEDGTVEETFYEGGSEEAEAIRLGAQQQAGQ